eukprot:CAMPEP_0174287286 /NCGR_PEP_ID=MMETSP0809-20121228/15259_1 /TAXON_ID=73025 ORGANISM="Eutreptiella gymnastica-like, Strain CCMP1594" /NCGR_SAMPLE_ID=MMETSP0809 /ASSEMBLY_ACC=CAM_ASM_000658 /LENGTH=78 /DNA_ID=CAMNT_0015383773 /DNA_START=357 /DNA_END=593 /DNA_ORIENTATION=-
MSQADPRMEGGNVEMGPRKHDRGTQVTRPSDWANGRIKELKRPLCVCVSVCPMAMASDPQACTACRSAWGIRFVFPQA